MEYARQAAVLPEAPATGAAPAPPSPDRSPATVVADAFRLWSSHLVPLAKLTAVLLVPLSALAVAAAFLMSESVVDTNEGPRLVFASQDDLDAFRIVDGAVTVASVLAGLIAVAAGVWLLRGRLAGAAPRWTDGLRATGARLGAVLAAVFLAAAGIAGGFVALVVPGIYLAVVWALTLPVVMLEDRSGAAALARSRRLVSGRWWATAGTLLLGALALLVLSVLLGLGAGFLGGVAGALLGDSPAIVLAGIAFAVTAVEAVVTPLLAALLVLLYADLRAAEEAAQPQPGPPMSMSYAS